MILEETINKFLRDSVDAIVGIDGYAIRAKQVGATRPTTPYANVDFLRDMTLGIDQTSFEKIDGDADNVLNVIEGLREIVYSINCYYDGAYDNAKLIKTGFKRESIIQAGKELGIGIITVSQVNNLSEVVNAEWELRAQFDITLSIVDSDQDTIAAINAATINGEYQNGSNQHSIEQTIILNVGE